MKTDKILLWTCIFLLLATAAIAATGAKIVKDTTAPGCTDFGYCNSLYATVDDGKSVIKTVKTAEPETTYTASFRYKLKSGKFYFTIDGKNVKELNDLTWKSYNYTFKTGKAAKAGGKVEVKLGWKGSGAAEFWLDEIQLTPGDEMTKFTPFMYEVGCCPHDFCWAGGDEADPLIEGHPNCIHDDFYEENVSMPPVGWTLADFGASSKDASTLLDAPGGYRCINGTWKFSRPKFTPLYDGAGFCPDESQCFIGGDDKASIACVANGTYHPYRGRTAAEKEYFYCYEGNWTTRTKDIALHLLNLTTEDDTYTIFCDKYDKSLNSDLNMTYWRDYVGDKVTTMLSSDMVNEFCVMDLNGQIIAGVSLNTRINETFSGSCEKGGPICWDTGKCDSNGCLKSTTASTTTKSFIEMLKGPDETKYCDSVITAGKNEYAFCKGEDVWYNANLSTVIFTKPTLPIQKLKLTEEKTLITVIFEYLKNIFRNLLGIGGLAEAQTGIAKKSSLDFIRKAGSFDKLYISFDPDGPNDNPREIKAIRETRAYKIKGITGVKYRTFLSVEYYNYQTDICRFFYRHNYHDVRAQISDYATADNIQCTPVILNDEEWMHSIYVEEPVFEDIPSDVWEVRIWKGASDNFWNDITAKIRTQPAKTLSVSAPDEPEFESEPETNPVVGTPVNFSVTNEPASGEKWIARTWDFGDGEMASSAFNITTWHTFTDTGDYDVTLCVMNDNYQITCADEETITIGLAPQVEIDVNAQTEDAKITIDFKITGGNQPFSMDVDWGDKGTNSTTNYKSATWTVTHDYTSDFSSLDAQIKRWVNITGTDRDGVEFENQKEVVIKKTLVTLK